MRQFATFILVPALIVGTAFAARAAAPTFEPPVVISQAPNTDFGRSDFAPVAVSNGSGTWVVAWYSDDTLHGTIDVDDDILFVRSTDGGLTFSGPAPLNTNAATDQVYFYGRVVGANDTVPALAAHGNRFIAVWANDALLNSGFLLAHSDDAGATWSAPAALASDAYTPSIASDGAGTWVIVWIRSPGGGPFTAKPVYFTRSTDDGAHFSPPAALNTAVQIDGLTDYNPKVVWSNGVWGVAWSGRPQTSSGVTTSKVFFSRSLDGLTWSNPTDLYPTSPTGQDRDVVLAGGGGGSWVATWTSGDFNQGSGNNLVTSRSTDGGLTWSAPAILNTDAATDGRDDYSASVAALDANTYAAVWTRQGSAADPQSDHSDVFAATSMDGGATWSPPVPLNPVSAAIGGRNDLDFYPSVTSDFAGHFLALWSSNDRHLISNTKGHDADIVMSMTGLTCGNGTLDPGEACDDGDRGSLDCCNRACAFDAPGAACAADADPCSLERCDGAGTCEHQAAPLETPCALDDDLCTNDRCDGNFVCEHVYQPRAVCPGSAKVGGSVLKMAGGASPAERNLTWSLKHGPDRPVTLFVNGATYALCVYDGTGLVARVDLPVDTSCKTGQSCWTATSKSIKYKDSDATPNGATAATLRDSGAGKTSLKVVAKGANLTLPALPMSLPIQAQLVSDDMGNCFGATYSATGTKQSATGFKGKSD